MRKLLIITLSVCAAVALAIAAAAPASAPVRFQIWHRLDALNAPPGNPAPEHQRYSCLEGMVWLCRYDKLPEPTLNLYWDRDRGSFVGTDVTSGWACPTWFPAEACQDVTAVVRGPAVYVNQGGPTITVDQELITTGSGASERMFMYWVNRFVCPWFQTFGEALSANPFPLPFDGVNWPRQDCTGVH